MFSIKKTKLLNHIYFDSRPVEWLKRLLKCSRSSNFVMFSYISSSSTIVGHISIAIRFQKIVLLTSKMKLI